jgi:hypothetical protein
MDSLSVRVQGSLKVDFGCVQSHEWLKNQQMVSRAKIGLIVIALLRALRFLARFFQWRYPSEEFRVCRSFSRPKT